MSEAPGPVLSVAALFAERDARRQREQEAEEQLKRKHEEELAQFKHRLETFELTEARLRAVLDRIIRGHKGRIANTAGDSVLSEFGSAVDAVQCAVEAQTALAEANSDLAPVVASASAWVSRGSGRCLSHEQCPLGLCD